MSVKTQLNVCYPQILTKDFIIDPINTVPLIYFGPRGIITIIIRLVDKNLIKV